MLAGSFQPVRLHCFTISKIFASMRATSMTEPCGSLLRFQSVAIACILFAVLFGTLTYDLSGYVPGYDGSPRTASEWHERIAKEQRQRQLPEGDYSHSDMSIKLPLVNLRHGPHDRDPAFAGRHLRINQFRMLTLLRKDSAASNSCWSSINLHNYRSVASLSHTTTAN